MPPLQTTPSQYDLLRAKLDELNYLYPFSPDSVTLIDHLLSDLVSTVTSYKSLERENEIKAEELRVAVEEINRVGVIENPKLVRENNELQMQLVREAEKWEDKSMELVNQVRSKDEEILRLELIVSQLQWKNSNLFSENKDLKERIDQFVLHQVSGQDDVVIPSTIEGGILDTAILGERPDVPSAPSFDSLAPVVHALQQENKELESLLLSAQMELEKLESKMIQLEDKFLGPSVSDSTSALIRDRGEAQLVAELNAKLDFVNSKYRELKEMHSRCGIVTDSPLVDLKESRKELNLVQVRYEKLRREYASLQSEVEEFRKMKVGRQRSISRSPSKSSSTTVSETVGHQQPHRRIDQLESQLKQVTADRDELISKLGEIEAAIGSMETDVCRIEKENSDLRREKISREESFVGISKQLEEVNLMLNTLSGDQTTTSNPEVVERLKFRIAQLEREVLLKEEEIGRLNVSLELVRRDSRVGAANRSAIDSQVREIETQLSKERTEREKMDGEIRQLKSLALSSTQAKDSAISDLRLCQKELLESKRLVTELRESVTLKSTDQARFAEEVVGMKHLLSRLDSERDELQRICDDQAEKIEVLRETNARLRASNIELEKGMSTTGLESDRVRYLLDEKENELDRLVKKNSDLQGLKNRQEVVVSSLQDQLTATSNETMELTRANQKLRLEMSGLNNKLSQLSEFHNTARLEVNNAIENLKITEKERDDILTMYKQLINENKHLQSNFSKLYLDRDQVVEKDTEIDSWKSQCEDLKKQLKQAQLDIGSLRTQLSRATDAARRSGGPCRITDADDMDIKLAELESKNEVLTLEIQELQERLKLENGFDKTCLMEKTIEQQYALIGEMDAEQARLIVENSRLREQVSLVSRIPAA